MKQPLRFMVGRKITYH